MPPNTAARRPGSHQGVHGPASLVVYARRAMDRPAPAGVPGPIQRARGAGPAARRRARRARAPCSSSAARPGSARRRCCATPPARRPGFRVAQIAGVESEMELPFAGLHQLCAPMLDRLDALPEPQRDALRRRVRPRVGRRRPTASSSRLAALSLLAAIAEERPLLCVVDDAQWLDDASAQVLGFVARRLLAESVALVFARPRAERRAPSLAGLPELRAAAGSTRSDARALLATVVPGRLDERVRDRIVAETRGNPLALLELPRGMSAAELAGGFALPDAGRSARPIEEQLPAAPRRAPGRHAAAGAARGGRPGRRRRCSCGARPSARHRSGGRDARRPSRPARDRRAGALPPPAACARRPTARRRRPSGSALHAALAEATDPELDPDRRAWHRAQAAAGPDEEVAEELERSAGARAGARRASPRPPRSSRARRRSRPTRPSARAARCSRRRRRSATPARSTRRWRCWPRPRPGRSTSCRRREVEQLRGADRVRPAPRRRRAARAAAARPGGSSRSTPSWRATTHLEALGAAICAGRLADGAGALLEVAREAAARRRRRRAAPARSMLLLDALATRVTDGLRRRRRRRCSGAGRRARAGADGDVGRWLWLTGSRATGPRIELWDADAWHALAARQVAARPRRRRARAAAVRAQLPRPHASCLRGRAAGGRGAARGGASDRRRRPGTRAVGYAELLLAAWRGQEAPRRS